jgi:hypothetical protein
MARVSPIVLRSCMDVIVSSRLTLTMSGRVDRGVRRRLLNGTVWTDGLVACRIEDLAAAGAGLERSSFK